MKRSCRLYCELSAGFLSCYFIPEEIEAKVEPTLNVPINKVNVVYYSFCFKNVKMAYCKECLNMLTVYIWPVRWNKLGAEIHKHHKVECLG